MTHATGALRLRQSACLLQLRAASHTTASLAVSCWLLRNQIAASPAGISIKWTQCKPVIPRGGKKSDRDQNVIKGTKLIRLGLCEITLRNLIPRTLSHFHFCSSRPDYTFNCVFLITSQRTNAVLITFIKKALQLFLPLEHNCCEKSILNFQLRQYIHSKHLIKFKKRNFHEKKTLELSQRGRSSAYYIILISCDIHLAWERKIPLGVETISCVIKEDCQHAGGLDLVTDVTGNNSE